MLAIGRALMTRPRLLMLDEPSQGIMPKLVDEIFAAIDAHPSCRHDHSHRRTTSYRVSGDREPCVCAADGARRPEPGTAADIRVNPDVRKAYLGL